LIEPPACPCSYGSCRGSRTTANTLVPYDTRCTQRLVDLLAGASAYTRQRRTTTCADVRDEAFLWSHTREPPGRTSPDDLERDRLGAGLRPARGDRALVQLWGIQPMVGAREDARPRRNKRVTSGQAGLILIAVLVLYVGASVTLLSVWSIDQALPHDRPGQRNRRRGDAAAQRTRLDPC
jgi:hypothetical protein